MSGKVIEGKNKHARKRRNGEMEKNREEGREKKR